MTYLKDWKEVVENNSHVYDYYKNKSGEELDKRLDSIMFTTLVSEKADREYFAEVWKIIQYIKYEREEK